MASTYSTNLKIELIATGEQAGTWGTTTNTNLGTALEQAIVGKADVTMSSTTVTLTLTNSNAAQDARAIYLNLTGSPGGAAVLEVPAVEKPYIVKNGTTGGFAVTVKVSGQTGVSVPNGSTMWLYNNGTDVTNAIDNLPSGTTIAGSTIGDVTGPASATDNAVARFDGTTGKIIQNSTGVTIADDGTTVISVNSTSDALRITQTGTGKALLVEDAANPDSTPFVVDANGLCIQGSTSSVTTPNYGGTASIFSLQTVGTATSGTGYVGHLFGTFNNSTGGPGIFAVKSRSGTIGGQTVVNSGDKLFAVTAAGSDGTGFIRAADISYEVDGTPGTNDMPGRLVFSTTADGASSPTERMRIDNQGRVGIGSTTLSGYGVRNSITITGSTNGYAFYTNSTNASDVTNNLFGYGSVLNTANAVTSLTSFYAGQGTLTGAVTNQYGFRADSTITGATNNYGFYSNIASGTGRWNLYMNGTAENYLGGNLKIGGTAARATTAGTNHLSIFNGTAPAGTLTNGISLYSSSGDFNFMDAAGGAYKVGYRNVPAVGTKTTSYTLQTADVGKYVQIGSGGSITIPDATFSEGDAVSLFNNTTGDITVTCTITTAYIAGADSDVASVTLATRGICTIFFISGTVCVITGNVS